ncbi:MAG TPA: exodeoxyribonuclease V subunit alpha [Burkholderiaceae bacterium]|nr:exodeoxyribonuclease V subunit alpha [Burkholderiaceae bacterium]
MIDTPDRMATAPSRDLVLAQIDRWVEAGWLRELDRAFALFLQREAGEVDALLLLAAALASHQLGRGHACLVLDAALADPLRVLALPAAGVVRGPVSADAGPLLTPAQLLAGVDLPRWRAALAHPRLVGDGAGATPLVLAGTRLYLRRYWQFERSIRAAIDARTRPGALPAPGDAALRRALAVLFPPSDAAPLDWQKLACALAARSAFAIVTGGPGTGKTTTVVKLLALLQQLALAPQGGGRALRIRMAAPTGKAAARLNESITKAVTGLALGGLDDPEAVRAAVPTEVATLHRLLGSRPDTRHFRHDARHPLALDVLVIDEASMVDLEMMAAVLAALPPAARLVLLGDKDQLASVEAGAVLGELCRRADAGHYLPATRDWLAQVAGAAPEARLVDAAGHPLDQCIAKLRHSYRFSADSGIGRLAEAVNAGDVVALRDVQAAGYADLAHLDAAADPGLLRALVFDGAPTAFVDAGTGRVDRGQALPAPVGYRRYLAVMAETRPAHGAPQAAFDDWARTVLDAFGAFQLLCALRGGPQGVEQMNPFVERLLHAQGLVAATGPWYAGRPVMVTRNDHDLGLMNGDVGIALALPHPGPSASTMLRVAFPSAVPGGVRWALPSRLQAVETAFAMTVHKSQGSEFVHAALLLPERASPVLTRELVYTGITRARHWFTLATTDPAATLLEDAIVRRVERASGLMA